MQAFLRFDKKNCCQDGSEKIQVADVVSEGEKVWVKVVAVDVEAQKISLSMKYVDQESGKDLDPFQVFCQRLRARAGAMLPAVIDVLADHARRGQREAGGSHQARPRPR